MPEQSHAIDKIGHPEIIVDGCLLSQQQVEQEASENFDRCQQPQVVIKQITQQDRPIGGTLWPPLT